MGYGMSDSKAMSPARRAYEEKQAKKAGKSLEAWLAQKEKRQAEANKPPAAPAKAKKPGLISRLLDRAHRPI